MNLFQGHPRCEGGGQVEKPLGVGGEEFGLELFSRVGQPRRQGLGNPEAADFQGAHRLLEGLLEGPADGHGFAHGFHRGGEDILRLRELLEGPAGDLHHAVIEGRLEGSHGFPGDVIGELIEGIADGELGGDPGDGEARRLGGQGRGAGDAGIHFDDDHLPRVRTDGELDVRSARFHADFPHDGDGGVAHDLVLGIGEGLGRGHGDGVARVDPHGIEVFDGADDHHVVRPVPHDLQLVFLPAQGRLFEHDLVDHAGFETRPGLFHQFFPVVGHAAARSSQGEGGADDDGKADLLGDGQDLLHRPGEPASRHPQADGFHGPAEKLPVLRLVDDREGGPDHLHPVALQDAAFRDGYGGVEPGLAAQGGQQGVWPLQGDDLLHGLGGDGLDVGAVGRFRVGHDGGRVAVDQDDLVTLFPQGFACLGSRVVKFAGLADDDRSRTDDQNLLKVFPFRHKCPS